MTEPDNFILRWATIEAPADIEREVDSYPGVTGPSTEPQEAVAIHPEANVRAASDRCGGRRTFDLSSLPSIEVDHRQHGRPGISAKPRAQRIDASRTTASLDKRSGHS